MPLIESDVEIEGGELTLSSVDEAGGPVITMHRQLRGRNHKVDKRTARVEVEDSIVLETTETSIRIMEVISSRSDAHAFRYQFRVDGKRATLLPDGEGGFLVALVRGKGDRKNVTVYGEIEPAWVVDANGNEVPVRFDLSKNSKNLRLRVPKQSAASYPLVADPKVRISEGILDCGWRGCTFYVKAEVTNYIDRLFNTRSGSAAIAIAASYLCGKAAVAAAAASGAAGLVIGAACAGTVALLSFDVADHADQAVRRNPDGCLTLGFGFRGVSIGDKWLLSSEWGAAGSDGCGWSRVAVPVAASGVEQNA